MLCIARASYINPHSIDEYFFDMGEGGPDRSASSPALPDFYFWLKTLKIIVYFLSPMRRACHHPWKEANKKIQEHKKCGKRHQHQHTISFPFSVVVSSGSSFFPCEILTAFHCLIHPWPNATLWNYSWSHHTHRNFDSLKPQSTRYLILQCERACKTCSKMSKL